MEVASGEHGDCLPKLVMAVNSGKSNNLSRPAQKQITDSCFNNDIAKDDSKLSPARKKAKEGEKLSFVFNTL